FIFFSLRSKDYLYYVLYLVGLVIFFSSNAGYVMELLLPEQPRLDLYIRFLSTPFLMFFYLQFSQAYLNTKKLTKLHQVINVLKGVFILSLLLMFPIRQWMIGRTVFIFTAIFSYLFILFVAYKEIRRGYSPAKYFMLANVLLIIGAVLFAMPRIFGNVQNPLTQYGVQLGVLLEVALFSVGLADRINVARRELAEQTLANERLQLEKEREKQKIIEEKAAELEQKVIERTKEVVEQKDEIEKKNKHITDSIRYAERIQNALLGSEEYIMEHFSDGFIFFKPKDIVSGDFYWFGKAQGKKVLIAADCTGHGVPGAFMTMMGNSFLNDIVSEDGVYEPSQILLMLDRKIKESLQGSRNKVQDGMDMSILTVDEESQKILYSGAKNPLCRVRDGEIERIKGSIFAVGGSDYGREKKYEQYEFPIVEGDIYYLFSDGYQDQFGKTGTKFMSKKFRHFLLEISDMKFSEQKETLSQTLDNWMGDAKQTDDILVIGVKV
ncbi:MAG: serine phosphatase RsbU (regulator of sigma subunit), partial [Arenicella sp.]